MELRSKFLLVAGLLTTVTVAHSQMSATSQSRPYHGSSFTDVWNKIAAKPYESLPLYKIVSAETLKSAASLAMNGTLDDRNDFRPRRVKLVHPNGVCLAGTWRIDEASNSSGYFSKGSKGLVIARASVTQDLVNIEEHRSFGLAVKIFPTLNPDEIAYTSNLFSVDNIEGVQNRRFTETLMTNQIPDFDFLKLSTVFRLVKKMPFLITFNNLSKKADTGPENRNPLFRRTIEVARAGITREYSAASENLNLPSYKNVQGSIKEPIWVGFQAEEMRALSNERDFRNEIIDV
ncbi:MAG TPA: hypothetical protein VM432_11080, partial [Bdellovibrionales bacterium]|nr:hypothetical protein [Bdellovibrionales bacterium]